MDINFPKCTKSQAKFLACISGRAPTENGWDHWDRVFDTLEGGGERLKALGAGRGTDNRAKPELRNPESNPNKNESQDSLGIDGDLTHASFDLIENLWSPNRKL